MQPPYGRKVITTSKDKVTAENLIEVLQKALPIHNKNKSDIDYLYNYFRGKTPILNRTKKHRTEICNKVNENHAQEIIDFKVGYLLTEPCTYVRRGDNESVSSKINTLNDFMYTEGKPLLDRQLVEWFEICGVAYRMVVPDAASEQDESPFELDVLDPRNTFLIYHSGFGKRPLAAVMLQKDEQGNDLEIVYTPNMYFEVKGDKIIRNQPHSLGSIPIIEYRGNSSLIGAFEPVLDIMDALNLLTSNRLDGVEQFIQSVMVFVNADISSEGFEELKEKGAIKVISQDGNVAKIEILSSELNQTQTQVLVDYLYQQLLAKTSLPSTTKGGSSTSDTGAAVILRDGWQQTETGGRATETLFVEAEKLFLKPVLHISKAMRGLDLKLSDISIKFTRHITDNALVKVQALTGMLNAGINPQVAISHCGMFHDPADVYAQSKEYLKKWEVNTNGVQEKTSEKAEIKEGGNARGTM